MKEAFRLVNRKDRRELAVVAALLGLALLFYFFGAMIVKNRYQKSVELLASIEKNISAAQKRRDRMESDWMRWLQAHQDVDELKENYFYSGEDWVKVVRLDLQRILDESRIQHSPKKFQYDSYDEERVGKVMLEFSVTGSYNTLKTFIYSVESFPKFFVIERIDFLDIDPLGMGIKLRILLAGYHAGF